jgi:phosphoadenosine phosphosulfate reductase
MALQTNTLFGVEDKVKIAIDRLKQYEPPEGYYLAFSGGKDSCVIKQLAIESGVKFDAHYNVTTIDPPELVRFIRKHHPDVIFDRPEEPFLWKLVKKGFPLRQARWCCELYKEQGGNGRTVITGIRWEESVRRKSWDIKTVTPKKTIINPIIDWDSEEVWWYIESWGLPCCELYDQGYYRLGCLFCPFKPVRERLKELQDYPGYEKAFRIAFNRLYEDRLTNNPVAVSRWQSGDEMFDWWIHGETKPKDKKTIDMFRQVSHK